MDPTGTDESDYRLDSLRRQLRHGWKIDAPVFGRDAYLSPAGRVRARSVAFGRCSLAWRKLFGLLTAAPPRAETTSRRALRSRSDHLLGAPIGRPDAAATLEM